MEEVSDLPGLLRMLGIYAVLAIVVVIIAARLLRQNRNQHDRIYDRSRFTKGSK